MLMSWFKPIRSRSLRAGVLALLLLVAGVFAAESPQDSVNPMQKGVTGIRAIDTLKVNEWDIPTERNSLPLTMLLSILPGGGHYYTEHYVRGGFITAIELALFYEVVYNKDFQYRRVLEQAEPFRDSVSFYTRKIMGLQSRDSLEYYQKKRTDNINRLRAYSDKKMEQEDLRKAETAWLYGLQLYSMFDAFGIWYKNNYRSNELRSMKSAALWAIIPGFGQMYNGEFGKAGLLYMGLMGASVSVWTSQNMVEYYLDRKHMQAGESTTSEDYERVVERVTYYRKNRNQYIWASALLYLYSIGDAVVDALLSDFDNPLHLALLPNFNGGAQALFTFDF
ncbi:hypothetical protein B7993_04865 [Fibrobacter sp. UWH3]|nr:hypothetical protein B7993_04865 [Fibrobacter sp. UWH3]OWV16956.1 hypothetical protein B7992_01495 [Fibrobacter sp. UWH1]